MLRSVLAIVDTTPGSERAGEVALEIASRANAALGVTGMLDLFWAMRTWHRPLIGLEIALEAERVSALYAAQSEAVERLSDAAAARGLPSRRVRAPESPDPAFAVFAHAYDLIVLARDAAFHLELGPHVRDPVERICAQLVRPVLVVPPEVDPGAGVLLGYDGSAAASRAAHLAVLLGLANDPPARVVSLRADVHEAEVLAETGAGLLRHHGVAAEPIALKGEGEEGGRFLELLAEQTPARVVIGGTGHGAWREALLGSTTCTLLHRARTPLLVGS